MHDYYTCLNTPSHLPSSKPSTADTRKDGAAPLPNARDATSQDPQVINGPHGPSLERHLLYATKNSNQCHHSHADDYTADAPQEPHNARTHIIFMHAHAINGATSSDQTGRFPITSNRGSTYVVVFYVFNANYICSVPIKKRSTEELLRAYC